MDRYIQLRKIVSLTILATLVINLAVVIFYRDVLTYVAFLIIAIILYPHNSKKNSEDDVNSGKQ